jgi:hypothetical protein
MLGRNNYTQGELDHAKKSVDRQLKAYKALAEAVEATGDAAVTSALEAFEPLFFNNMVPALDRPVVHRVRMVAGKDGNPINELELLAASLIDNDGVLEGNNVIKFVPDQSVLKLDVGDRIALSAAQFERLYKAFLKEIRAKFS